MISNNNYRSGAVRSVPDRELPRKTNDERSGTAQDNPKSESVGTIKVKPAVRIVVRRGKLAVVAIQ